MGKIKIKTINVKGRTVKKEYSKNLTSYSGAGGTLYFIGDIFPATKEELNSVWQKFHKLQNFSQTVKTEEEFAGKLEKRILATKHGQPLDKDTKRWNELIAENAASIKALG